MSRICKSKPSDNVGQKQFAGDIVCTDRTRSYIINPSSSCESTQMSKISGVAPLAAYDTDTTTSDSSLSSILSAATSGDFSSNTPWLRSLEEARTQGLHISSASSDLLGRMQVSNTTFYENVPNRIDPMNTSGTSEGLYENQQIINNHNQRHLGLSSTGQEVVYENSSNNSGYEAANRNKRYSSQYTPLSNHSSDKNYQAGDNRLSCDGSTILSAGYEEPWELESAQIDLISDASDWFRGSRSTNSSSGSQRSSGPNSNPSTVSSGRSPSSSRGQVMVRSYEGQARPNEGQARSNEGQARSNEGQARSNESQMRSGEGQIMRSVEGHLPQMREENTREELRPHEKDNRNHDSYAKPWDLKPHQKDDRTTGEYDRPWDERLKNIECDLAAAKIAKDAIKISRNRAGRGGEAGVGAKETPAGPLSGDLRGSEGYDKPWDLKPHQKDDRRSDDYEQAWDKRYKDAEGDVIAAKLAKEASRLADGIEKRRGLKGCKPAGEGGGGEGRGRGEVSSPSKSDVIDKQVENKEIKKLCKPPVAAPRAQSTAQQSAKQAQRGEPSRKPQDPNHSLERQRWFHGSLGRSQAELVMKETDEGSFLVRRSDVNINNFSLSIRSATGFIHLKIVLDSEGRYVLGQFSKPFSSITQMIHHYTVAKLPIKGAEHMTLTTPVPSAND